MSEKKPAKKKTAKKAPAKKAVAKKSDAKKPAGKKPAKKAPAKQAPIKRQAPKVSVTTQPAKSIVSETTTSGTPETVITSEIIRVNDVQSKPLRKRMLAWFTKK